MSTQPTTLELRADTSGLQSVRTLLGVIADESQRAEASVRRIVETWSQPNALGSIRSWSEAQGTAFSRMGAVSYPGGSTGSPPSPFASSGLMPRTGTPDLSWDQIHMGAWQERLSSMATERMLNPGYQANVERAIRELGAQIDISLVTDPQWIQAYGLVPAQLPAVVLARYQIKAVKSVPEVAIVKEWVKDLL